MHLAGLSLWHLVFGDTLCFTIGCDIFFFYPFIYRPKNRMRQYRDYNLNFRYENTFNLWSFWRMCVKLNRTIVNICLGNSNNCTSTIGLCDAEGSWLHFKIHYCLIPNNYMDSRPHVYIINDHLNKCTKHIGGKKWLAITDIPGCMHLNSMLETLLWPKQ